MNIIQKGTFKDQRVSIDEAEYKDCRFTNCVLVYSGGTLILRNCTFIDCHLFLDGPAGQTIGFLATFYSIFPPMVEEVFEAIKKGPSSGTPIN